MQTVDRARNIGNDGVKRLLLPANQNVADGIRTAVYSADARCYHLKEQLGKNRTSQTGNLYVKSIPGKADRIDILIALDKLLDIAKTVEEKEEMVMS